MSKSLIIRLKHKYPSLWNVVERVNGFIFKQRHGQLELISRDVIGTYNKDGFSYDILTKSDIDELIVFRQQQPAGYLKYFDPHPFDHKTLNRLLDNPSYSLMKIREKKTGKIVAYFFLRCFFVGKAIHGLITDSEHTNLGLGTSMWQISMEICRRMGFRMYATVSQHNIASLTSARNATEVSVSENLANEFYLIECTPKSAK